MLQNKLSRPWHSLAAAHPETGHLFLLCHYAGQHSDDDDNVVPFIICHGMKPKSASQFNCCRIWVAAMRLAGENVELWRGTWNTHGVVVLLVSPSISPIMVP